MADHCALVHFPARRVSQHADLISSGDAIMHSPLAARCALHIPPARTRLLVPRGIPPPSSPAMVPTRLLGPCATHIVRKHTCPYPPPRPSATPSSSPDALLAAANTKTPSSSSLPPPPPPPSPPPPRRRRHLFFFTQNNRRPVSVLELIRPARFWSSRIESARAQNLKF